MRADLVVFVDDRRRLPDNRHIAGRHAFDWLRDVDLAAEEVDGDGFRRRCSLLGRFAASIQCQRWSNVPKQR